MDVEKLKKMASSVRTGGKGTMRRKKKAVHKTTTTDDKRLQSTLKRIGVNAIPAIEEVNIFKDEIVIQFLNPKVQASIAANTWVVSGSPQTKSKLIFIFFLHLVCCKIELSLCYLIWYVLCQILTSIERAFSMSLSIMQVCDHSCSANLQALQALIPLWAWTSLFNVLSH